MRGSAPRTAVITWTRSRRNAAASFAHRRTAAMPFQADAPTSPSNVQRAHRRHHGIVARHDQHGRDGDAAFRDRGLGEPRRDRALEPHGLGIDELAAAPHAPAVGQRALLDRLAHAGAAEHDGLGEKQLRVGRERHLDRTRHACPVEQDRLLRQPGERRAIGDIELHVDDRVRPERAVDLLGRRRGHDQPRSLLRRDVEREPVAARDAARRVDEHRLKLGGRRAGTAHAQRARFVHARAARLAGDLLDRKRKAADRTVGGEDRIACRQRAGHNHSFRAAPILNAMLVSMS